MCYAIKEVIELGQWILISLLAMCIGIAIIIAILCVAYKECDKKSEEAFKEWLRKKKEGEEQNNG